MRHMLYSVAYQEASKIMQILFKDIHSQLVQSSKLFLSWH